MGPVCSRGDRLCVTPCNQRLIISSVVQFSGKGILNSVSTRVESGVEGGQGSTQVGLMQHFVMGREVL